MRTMLRGLLACVLLALLPLLVQAQTEKPPEWTRAEKELADKAKKLNDEGGELFGMGKRKEALEKIAAGLEIRRQLYPKKRFKGGHPDLASSLNDMGFVLSYLGQSDKGLPYIEQALAMRRQLYPNERFPDGHPDLVESLTNMGFVLDSLGESGKALPYYEQALAMCQKLYPKERFPNGHPDLARNLSNLGGVLKNLGESSKALSYCEQALAMQQKLYPKERFPNGQSELATSLGNMGIMLDSLGESGKALPYSEQALAMRKKLYPKERFKDGHPELAISLLTMGSELNLLGEPDKALPYLEQALAMCQKLYPKERFPDGHRLLERSLTIVGSVLVSLGKFGKGLPYYEQALAMNQKLYPKERFPDGHPDLAYSFHHLSMVLLSLGELGKALPYEEQALAMRKKLYPKERFPGGHPELAASLSSMGALLKFLGKSSKALPYYEQALAMYQKLNRRESSQSSEAQALAYRQQQPKTRDGYLSMAVPSSKANYASVWHSRGDLLPLLQARHQQRLVLNSRSQQDYKDLSDVRRQLTRLQSNFPNDPKRVKERDAALAKLTDEQDRLERKLAAALPEFKHLLELADKGPADLAKVLPRNAAFVDLIRYNHWNNKHKIDGQRYVAFVLLPGQDAKIIDLGNAQAIDEAATAWREHIDKLQPSLAPGKLRELVWDKIDKHLTAQTKIIYLCPDGDLTRIPFAALPGKHKGTILLEDYSLALVPSGPWLLGQLLYLPPASDDADRVLAVGDVAYGQSTNPKADYPALPATGRELKRVLEAFAPKDAVALSGAAATAAAVRTQLPTVRYAHFATHGYFNDKELTAERQRYQKTLATWTLQDTGSRLGGAGLRNPAVYTGLVFAGVNHPAADDPDRGLLTGLNLLDLPLEKLRLCVLSACETGLGELTEGEGVLGLQRSFHAAGCANVIGSLWTVNDEATAALMTQFYYELRVHKRTPLESLCLAQLTLYRHPERLARLAKGYTRGKINKGDTVTLGSQPPETKPGETAKTTPTKLWAAFVLSGRGE